MGWIKAVAAIANFLEKLLDIIDNYVEKKNAEKENKQAQEEHDAIERDPVDFLNQHFGVPEGSGKDTSTTSTEAKTGL